MAKYCPRCGAQGDDTDKFCLNCGYNLKIKQTATLTEKTYVQTQEPIRSKPNKPYAKVIAAMMGIIVIIVVIAVLFLFVFQSGSDQITEPKGGTNNDIQNGNEETLKFIGTWNYEYEFLGTVDIIINNDNTLDVGYSGIIIPVGNWSMSNDELCLTTTEDIFEMGLEGTTQCFAYSLSNDENTLTLTATGIEDIVLTK